MQVPIALGTQTGGSTIRPGSFNGIYALKPTWNSISREGQKVYSLILDTLGLYARSAADLDLLADIFALRDDERTAFAGVRGASFGVLRGPAWANAGEGTQAALAKAADLLRTHGAVVEDVELPSEFDDIIEQHRIVLQTDGNTAFLPEYRLAREQLGESLQGHVENVNKFTHKQQLAAFDSIGALRPKMDEILGRYAAIVTPSVPDEAPVGLEKTGSAIFCNMWTVSVTPGS
jgi:Asp-tRNA(Asn)/Glu-tRNA(Gln) amidotransferase A subunit family amidase